MRFLIPILFVVAQIQAQPVAYPLHVGDRWQYVYFAPPLPSSPAYTIRVVSDTIMPGGKQYAVIQDETWNSKNYVRQTGDSVYVYKPALSHEFLYFDFSRRAGDTVSSTPTGNDTMDVVFQGVGIITIYGRPLREWVFSVNPGRHMIDDEYSVYVVDSVGVIRTHPSFGDESYLLGACIDGRIYGTIDGAPRTREVLPGGVALFQNYPNPFNPSTNIRYLLPGRSHVRLSVFNSLGQLITTLVHETQEPGQHNVRFDGSRLPSGVYLCRLEASSSVQSKRLLLLR